MATEIPVQDADRDTIQIQGHEFSVPAPFHEGYTLRENDANVLNQTYQENIRNNFADKIKQKAKEMGVEAKDLPSDTVSDLQQQLEDYVADYDFGVRRGGGGGRKQPTDPVEAEARNMAREMLKKALHNKDLRLKDYTGEEVEKMVDQVLEKKGDELRDSARQIVEARKQAGEGLDLDL